MNEKEIFEIIVKSLVDETDQVNINSTEGDNVKILELRVAKKDLGKIIGKQGTVIKSIQTLLKCIGAKNKKKILVELLPDDSGQ